MELEEILINNLYFIIARIKIIYLHLIKNIIFILINEIKKNYYNQFHLFKLLI